MKLKMKYNTSEFERVGELSIADHIPQTHV